MYLSATVIDVKTAKVISSAKRQFDSLDNIFNILPGFVRDISEGLTLIGSTGPGGGLICNIEGNRGLECSEVLGSASWENAKKMCAEFRGGGYDDWYLPSKEELNFIYVNLVKTGKIIMSNSIYWSSSKSDEGGAWIQSFYVSGGQSRYEEYKIFSVRAVRAFNIDD